RRRRDGDVDQAHTGGGRGAEALRLHHRQHQGARAVRDDLHRPRAEDSGDPVLQGLERHPAGDRLDLRPSLVGVLTRSAWRPALLLLIALASLPTLAFAQAPSAAELARGKYIVGATRGCRCHTVPTWAVHPRRPRY